MNDTTPIRRHRNEGPGGCVPWEEHVALLKAFNFAAIWAISATVVVAYLVFH